MRSLHRKHRRGQILERDQYLRETTDLWFALEQGAIITQADTEGTITYVNDAFCQISGYTREEVLGQNHRIMKSGLHPLAFFEDLWKTITAGQVWKGEVCNKAKDGHPYWVHMTIVPFLDPAGLPHHYLAVRFDITDRKKAESDVLRTLQEREELLEAVSVGRLVPFRGDTKRGTLVLGEAARDVFGVDPGAFLNPGDLEILLDSEGRGRFANALAMVAPGSPAIFQSRLKQPGASALWTRWTIQQDGTGLRGVIQDVTEQQELEARLRQAQKLESLGTLVSGIAHDFNNLLTAVLGSMEVLSLDPTLSEEHQRRVSLALRAAERGRQLVSRLSAFSRKSSHDWSLSDLNHIVHEVATMAGHAIPDEIQLVVDLKEDLPLTYLDPGQLHQALLNLVLNARDALGIKGRIFLRTGRERLEDPSRLAERRPGEYLFAEVADDGPGIPQEIRARIFEPFFTTKPTGKGTGLGLSVVHGVVQRHLGILELDTEPGRGACFRVLLPFMPTEAPLQEAADPQGPLPLGLAMTDGQEQDELVALLHTLGRKVRILNAMGAKSDFEGIGALFLDSELAPSILRELLAPEGPASGLPWVALGEDPTRGIATAMDLRPIAVLPQRPSLKQLLRVVALL